MAKKSWFGGSKQGGSDPGVDVDTLIAHGDLETAQTFLKRKLRSNNGDIHSRLKLAEVQMKMGHQRDAVDEYLIAAEGYARDGFFDKSTALLRKIEKLAPTNEKIAIKIQALQRAKDLERRRDLVLTSLLEADAQGEGKFRGASHELQQLWTELAQSSVVEALNDDQLRRLFGAIEVVRFDEDQEVAGKGQRLDVIFLVGKGRIEARIPLKGDAETAIRSFSGGDLIGDRALLEHKPWPARYVAVKRTSALRLDREGLASTLTGEADPKGFLDSLRQQRQDHQVVSALREFED